MTDVNELLNLILDNSFGNIFVTNGSGEIIYVNEKSVQALGIPRERLLCMTIYDLVDQGIASSAATITALESVCG